MVITSCIDGRLRVRDPRIQTVATAAAVKEAVLALPGVVSVAVNERVGSLLILYSDLNEGLARVLARLRELLGVGDAPEWPRLRECTQKAASFTKTIRRPLLNFGMLFSLVASLIGAIIDAEIFHVAAGAVFLAVVGIHVYERRRALLALG